MSSIKDEVAKMASQMKERLSLDPNTGVVTMKHTLSVKPLQTTTKLGKRGTKRVVKKVEKHNQELITAAVATLGELTPSEHDKTKK